MEGRTIIINSHPILSLLHNPNHHYQSKKMEDKATATATEVPDDEKKADEAKTVEDKKDGADETTPPADDAAPKKDDEAKAPEDAPKDDAKMTDKDDKAADEAPKDGDEAKKDEEVRLIFVPVLVIMTGLCVK